MVSSTLAFREMDEVQRLKTLLPDALSHCVTIAQSIDVKPSLIHTQQLKKRRFEIQLDLLRWQLLDTAQRDLLFWHEVARIQGRAIVHNQRDLMLLGVGLGTALLDTAMQNVLLLSGSLLVAGLAGYQLYQRNRGERSLKKATAADQAAIALAVQFGYDFPSAYDNLHSALTTLAKQAPHNAQRVRYEARQNVLEIFARHHDGRADSGSTDTDDRARYSRPSLSLHAQSRPKTSTASERYFSF
jgi:Protein of unknown function (DUF3318)